MKKLGLYILLILTIARSKAQNNYPNPYQLDLSYFSIEIGKQEISENRIQTIRCLEYSLKKNNRKSNKRPKEIYKAEFHINGNPKFYKGIRPLQVRPIRSLFSKLFHFHAPRDQFSYAFLYDTHEKLVHVTELIQEAYSPYSTQNIFHFYYNPNGNLSKEIRESINRYPNTLVHIKARQLNDSSLLETRYVYSSQNKIDYWISCWYSSQLEDAGMQCDSQKVIISMDSLFKYSNTKDTLNTTYDSLGRITQSVLHRSSGMPIGGGPCITFDSPGDLITRYFYDAAGRMILSESSTRSGGPVTRTHFQYNSAGLPVSYYREGSKVMTCFEYTFFD